MEFPLGGEKQIATFSFAGCQSNVYLEQGMRRVCSLGLEDLVGRDLRG